MGDASDQEMLDVEHQPTWTIGDQNSFTEFIKDLRAILADHQDREDIYDRHVDPNLSSSRKHPLLAKPRAEQPVRWIHIELQVVEGEESFSSATLLMSDDNVDVIGFINQSGVCYDFADRKRSARRMLPQEYKSVLLGWGNSYKSILAARNAAEVMDTLTSARLGKSFATHAIRVLSRFPGVADDDNPRLAVLGLMFMVSESARMNPVHDAIAGGWDTGTGFTNELMTDHVWKYVDMSRRLRQWKRRGYAEQRPDSELRDIYLVLNGYAELVYTIGDEISFISFMTDLRLILGEHPEAEDVLDLHEDRNLSDTRDHPVLAKQRAGEQPARWIHVKLQVVEGEETSWTTLFMRDDNLYVCGFMNQQGVCYQLGDHHPNASTNILLPITNGCDDNPPVLLDWGVSYRSMLDVQSSDHAVCILEAAHLGCDFAKKAVHVLSSYPDQVTGIDLRHGAREALAGLIVIVCESARMNPPHDSFARGWSTGMGFAKQLMKDYVWKHGQMSRNLMKWRSGGYDNIVTEHNYQPHPITELQTVHLVLRTHTPDQAKQEENNKKSQHSKPDNAGNDGDYYSNKPGKNGRGGGPPRQSRGGHNASGGGHGRKRGYNNGTSGGPQSQHKKLAWNVGSSGSPASKSEEASAAHSGGKGDGKSEEVRDADSGGGPASQPDHAGDDETGSSSGGSASQLGEAGDTDTRSSGGSASSSQPGGAGDNSPSRGSSGSQPGEVDVRCQGNGRPLVELLAIRADLRVKGTKIIVFDGRRGQIIYSKEELGQGEQGMVDLVLTGPYKGISAYGCFAIKIDIPTAAAAPGGRSGDAGGTLEWEWDCYEMKYAAQVDEPPIWQTIRTPDGCREVAQINYAVMSNALEATVEVMLRLQDGQSPGGVYGEITAYIGDFQDGSVLFSRTQGTRQSYSPSPNNDGWWCVELARNLVAVPCGKLLHIKVDLQLETSNIHINGTLEFNNGVSSPPSLNVDGNEVKVNITWYPEMARPSHPSEQKIICVPTELSGAPEVKMMYGHHVPDVVYTIGDEVSFTRFISALRRLLAEHPNQEDILEHPVLAKQRAEQPARWLHVKLQVVEGEETFWTTLLMRDDSLYVHGFVNQQEVVYELLDNQNSAKMLPDQYKSRPLEWSVTYKSILRAKSDDEAMDKLAGVYLGRKFAEDAVRILSSFSYPDKGVVYLMGARRALAGLIAMTSEATRMNPVNNSIAVGWRNGEGFTEQLMADYVWKYTEMSHKLQAWKSRNYAEPEHMLELQATYLVLNTWLPDYNSQSHGRPLVELLAIRADLVVIGTTIIVFDGKRGQIIFRKEEQAGQGMVDLVLTGPYTGISALGCFAIKIDIPADAAGSSSGGNATALSKLASQSPQVAAVGDPIKWEWDGYEPKYAGEVDKPPVSRTISSGPGRNVQVMYAVMSNAKKVTVQVVLHLKDGHNSGGSGIHGKITARIHGCGVGSVLFSRTQGMGQCLSPTEESGFLLQLDRNVVAVPCGRVLHVEVDLHIETTSNDKGIKHLNFTRKFPNGAITQRFGVDDDEVEVNITWHPEVKTISEVPAYTIREDKHSFHRFIEQLRAILTDYPNLRYLWLKSGERSAVLARRIISQQPPARWVHIKLLAEVEGKVTWRTTVVVRGDDLFVCGFMNKKGDWFELGDTDEQPRSSRWTLPPEYDAQLLDWGLSYNYRVTDVENKEEVAGILQSVGLGKTFAEDAVRTLSRFPDVADGDNISPSLALLGLSVMVLDSARINPVQEAIEHHWNNGTALTKRLMDYIGNWFGISRTLLEWNRQGRTWPRNKWADLESVGIKSPRDALRVVQLVLNVPP